MSWLDHNDTLERALGRAIVRIDASLFAMRPAQEIRDRELEQRLSEICAALIALHVKVSKMSKAMDDVLAVVSQMETVEQSAIALLQTIKAELDAAISTSDQDALIALSQRLGNDTAALAAAVAANTPADPGSTASGSGEGTTAPAGGAGDGSGGSTGAGSGDGTTPPV